MSSLIASDIGLVPRRRLGTLLAERRELYGYTVADMARRSMGQFSESRLEAIELGQGDLDDVAIEALSLVYEFNSRPPSKQRSHLIIADDEYIPVSISADAFDSTLVSAVLQRYVALLYLLRNQTVGEGLPLRGDDTSMLASAFRCDEEVILSELDRIIAEDMALIGEYADRMRRRLVVPAAGLLVGPTPAGMLVLVK
jgi:hypothetical protein